MIETINPATAEKLENFEFTTPSELDAKLDRAVAAQKNWRKRSFAERAAILSAAAKVLHSRKDELATTATREMGKPLSQAIAEVEKCAWCCDHYAEAAARYLADEIVETNAQRSYVGFRPLGIVLAVMPWNFPYWQVFRAAAPALMAGNAMMLKHASNVSRCALEIESVFRQAGAPEGLFTTLLLSSDTIADLVADERISAATLTGSEGAGMSVAAAAGHALKKCVLELGGSDPFIVLADADIDAAAGGEAGKGFVALTPAQRLDSLQAYDSAALEGHSRPYLQLKELVLMGYYLSEPGATQELRYELAPGVWEPAMPVTRDTRAWAV